MAITITVESAALFLSDKVGQECKPIKDNYIVCTSSDGHKNVFELIEKAAKKGRYEFYYRPYWKGDIK